MTTNDTFCAVNTQFLNSTVITMIAEKSDNETAVMSFNVHESDDCPDYVIDFTLNKEQISTLDESKYTGCFVYKISDENVSITVSKEFNNIRLFIEDRNGMAICFDLRESEFMKFLDVVKG